MAKPLVPSWAEARDLLAAFDPEGEAGCLRNVAELRPILACIRSVMSEMRLEDRRRE